MDIEIQSLYDQIEQIMWSFDEDHEDDFINEFNELIESK